jgi:hypothetical protein
MKQGEKLIPKMKKPFEGIVDCIKRRNWFPRRWDARTPLAACETIDLKIIYAGQFPCWKDEVARIRKANAASSMSSLTGE